MEHNPLTTDRLFRIPPIIWVLGLTLIAALAAVFIFKVAVSTVAYYGFFALMMGSHFFMHGSHGGHGGRTPHRDAPMNANGSTNEAPPSNEHARHSGGCH